MLLACLLQIIALLKTIVFWIGKLVKGQKVIIALLKDLVSCAQASKKPKRGKTHPDEISQAQVARDLGFSRATINRWERKQTEDGPGNTSNKFGYYKSLRTNPQLHSAYYELVNCARKYRAAQKAAAAKGQRFVTFVRFREEWLKHATPIA